MIVDCQFASWEFVEKNVTSHLSALRTIFLEVLHSATAGTARCSSFSATSLLWWLLMRVYKALQLSLLTYAAPAWQPWAAPSRIEQLERCQNKALRGGDRATQIYPS